MQDAYNSKPNNDNDYLIIITIVFHGAKPLVGQLLLIIEAECKLIHTTLGRTPLDE